MIADGLNKVDRLEGDDDLDQMEVALKYCERAAVVGLLIAVASIVTALSLPSYF